MGALAAIGLLTARTWLTQVLVALQVSMVLALPSLQSAGAVAVVHCLHTLFTQWPLVQSPSTLQLWPLGHVLLMGLIAQYLPPSLQISITGWKVLSSQ